MAMNENDPGGAPARDPALDRLYRDAGGEGPPAHLDAAILAAAHREVGARPRARPGVLRRWQVPVSIAAVVVLSVSLVTLVREEGGERLVQPSPPPPRPAAEPSRPAPVPLEEKSEGRREAARQPSEPVPADVAEPLRNAPAAAGSLARDRAGETGPALAQQGGMGSTTPPELASRPLPSQDAAAPVERREAARPVSPAEDVAVQAPAVAAARSAAPAPAAKPGASRLMASEARKEAGATPVWQDYEHSPPQKWLDRIGELRKMGRQADAEAMLAEFRRRFPSHPLPSDSQ